MCKPLTDNILLSQLWPDTEKQMHSVSIKYPVFFNKYYLTCATRTWCIFLKHSMTCLFFLWFHTGRWRALASFCGSWVHVFWNTTQGRGERLNRRIFHSASKDLFICLLPERTLIVVKWKAHTDLSTLVLVCVYHILRAYCMHSINKIPLVTSSI